MKAKWGLRTVILFGAVLLLTGCWDSNELKNMAIVMAMGVDKAPKTDQYRVSFQIINPGAIATGTTGGGGGGLTVTPVTVYTGTGSTLAEAVRKSSQKSPRQLFFPHLQLLIIGEDFAKDGIQDLFDIFERSHKARLTTMVLVARGSEAYPILRTLTPLEKIPANAVAGKIKNTAKLWSENSKVQIDDLIKSLSSKGDPIISGVQLVGDPEAGYKKSNVERSALPAELDIKGIALFKDGKLKRWLDGPEARGTVWIKNKMKGTIVSLDCKDKKNAIGIENIRSHTDVKAEVQDGKPIFHIRIREEGNVLEAKCPIDLSKAEIINGLEQEWATETKTEVMKAVKAAQSEQSDIFGFGEAVNRTNPKAWEKMKKDWGKSFAESEVDVQVDAYIRRTGMRLKPYMSKKEEQE